MWLTVQRPFLLEFTYFLEPTKSDFPKLVQGWTQIELPEIVCKTDGCVCSLVVCSLQKKKMLSLLNPTKIIITDLKEQNYLK